MWAKLKKILPPIMVIILYNVNTVAFFTQWNYHFFVLFVEQKKKNKLYSNFLFICNYRTVLLSHQINWLLINYSFFWIQIRYLTTLKSHKDYQISNSMKFYYCYPIKIINVKMRAKLYNVELGVFYLIIEY